jgi:hypothetical protein
MIIPGLIDAHVERGRPQIPRLGRYHGARSPRPLDSILYLRNQVNTGAVRGPRIYSAGAMIDGLPTTYPDALGANSLRTPARR